MEIKNKELNTTDTKIVEIYYKLLDRIRAANPKLTKAAAIELATVMTSKVYARSVINELDKLNKQNNTSKLN